MADFALQRKNMVESQVRPSDITDRRIIRAMLELPREEFCPQAAKATAYRDEIMQIGGGQGGRARSACAPRTLAKLIQALDLGDHDAVLELGAGTGYAAAVLSRIAAQVIAVEADATLAAAARIALQTFAASKVIVTEGDPARGHASAAPYD
jgi:protein-L-isoaspartate(D-aspartate) O-methyltransferase